MEDGQAFWEASMGAAFSTWNLYATFMACAGIPVPVVKLPDNTKRDRLLASLQHGLRDENPDRCERAMSALAEEFCNQDLVYCCLMNSVTESFELFGPELTYRIVENMGKAAPQSRICQSTGSLLLNLADYCDYAESLRSTTFHSLSHIMSRAGISGSVMNRARAVTDYKVTHNDTRQWITPVEFLKRYQQPDSKSVPQP